MKQRLFILLLGILGCVSAPATDFATEVLDATYKLFHKDSTATCFFIRRESPDEALYLVTAAHVLERTKGETAIVVLRERDANGSYKRRDYSI